jgi:hypothetical protein
MRFNSCVFLFVLVLLGCNSSNDSAMADGGGGQGGSMTRFAIQGNYMYVVSNSSIEVFSTLNNQFEKVHTEQIEWGLETIFARGEYLYLGAQSAMFIYSIADPEVPTFLFRYEHITSCDPVVVQGNRAYVTMSSGSACNLGANALEIIDITNPTNPTLIRNYQMTSPGGLAVDDNLVFVCEGSHGVTVLDISVETQPQEITTLTGLDAYDVILRNGIATITGKDGIFQYSYSSSGTPFTLVSKIPVTRVDL